MSRIMYKAVVVLLVLTALLPWSAAATQTHRGARRTSSGRFEVTAPFASLGSWLVGLWEKNGCMIDPNGRCLTGTGAAPTGAAPSAPTNTDNGCGLDPDGRCKG